MNIIVLVKQVPDTTEMSVDKETGTLLRAGVPAICNPDDLAAVEEALKLKDQLGAHVRVLCMGPGQAEPMLMELRGMGADEVTLISDRAFAGSDTWATSNTLAAAISLYPYDLIIAGRQAIDGDTAQVGPQTAEKLGLPQITLVTQILSCQEGVIRVIKEYEDYSEELEADLPLLITCVAGNNTPRHGRVDWMWESFVTPVDTLNNQNLKLDARHTGLSGSPTLVKKTFPRTLTGSQEVKAVAPAEAAEIIAAYLAPYLQKGGK